MTNLKLIFIVLLLIIAAPLYSQGAPPATPIDGGLGLLLAGGAAYGIKRVLKKK